MIRKTYAIGDIHGCYEGLMQCLERSNFDYLNDRLISLGDIADGWPEVVECFEELEKIKNMVYVKGNHDVWLRDWLNFGTSEWMWLAQGGQASVDSYNKYGNDIKEKHRDILNFKTNNFFVDEENRVYVHGGFIPVNPIQGQSEDIFIWDRDLLKYAYSLSFMNMNIETPIFNDNNKDIVKEVFIGHTATCSYQPDLTPLNFSNLWNLDQGAGWYGKLTIMNVETKEYFQSDLVTDLYPNHNGRR